MIFKTNYLKLSRKNKINKLEYILKMIVDPDKFNSMTISIYLKDGRKFENKDVPSNINDLRVACWDEDKIRVFPLDEVREYTLRFDNN